MVGIDSSLSGRRLPGRGKLMHQLFDVVIVLKGLDGILEAAAGLCFLFVEREAIRVFVTAITARELSEDPGDFIATTLQQWAAAFGQDTQAFVIAYLLFHGVAKVTLATSLLMEKDWAFPVALIFFSVFVAYASFRLYLGWSWLLAAIILLDLATISLVAREWRVTRSDGAGRRRG